MHSCALVVIRVRRIHFDVPLWSSGSLGSFGRVLWVVGFIRIRWVETWGSLGSFWGALGVVGFVPVRSRARWVHSGAPLGSSVYSVSLGSFRRALGVVWFIRVRWVHSVAHWGRPVHSGSLQTRSGCRLVDSGALGVVGFVSVGWVHWSAPWRSSRLFGFVGFIRTRPGGHSAHSGAL